MTRRHPSNSPPAIRCAIYTRKSTEEGLEQAFNSLAAQRESAEHYIASLAHEGWICLPERYDDGGYSGGSMDRPAIGRLLADIEAGDIGCVVVYRADRITRSLIDFARIMDTLQKHDVSFVSVTESFDTSQPGGRLHLHMMLSFAQYERELVSERTRHKIAATRRKGKWAGGHPVLGYDVDPQKFKLRVNEEEAERVRRICALYLEHEGLIPVVEVLNDRDWRTKRWITRKGHERGGRPFDKCRLHKLLTNVVYIGKVRYKEEIHEGEHDGIVEPEIWHRVQQILARNRRTGGAAVRNKYGALLKGLLHCVPCNCSMGHTYSTKSGNKRYRYYVCLNAQKRGWDSCPSKSVPAEEIERLVIEQIRAIGRDPSLIASTIEQVQQQATMEIRRLESEQTSLQRELKQYHGKLRRLVADSAAGNGSTVSQLGDLNERIRCAEQRLTEIRERVTAAGRRIVSEDDVAQALESFDPVWEMLSPKEQARIVRLLIERIDYDGEKGKLSLTFRPTGLLSLGQELTAEEAAA